MRFLVLYAHPVETSFCAALHQRVIDGLTRRGHVVDDCDLYAEAFDPVLAREERLIYHDVPANEATVADHVARVRAAGGLVLVYPVWNFGFPAILKGYFDRVFLPGVAFRLEVGRVKPALPNIRRIVAVTTYGADPLRAFLAGDPPRKMVTRVLPTVSAPRASVTYLAHYDMNRSTDETRRRFLQRVGRAIERF
jgi:NAD(P)H dehydrogenase (quinone)